MQYPPRDFCCPELILDVRISESAKSLTIWLAVDVSHFGIFAVSLMRRPMTSAPHGNSNHNICFIKQKYLLFYEAPSP
eukprot:2720565-Amphidinium_carterae.1